VIVRTIGSIHEKWTFAASRPVIPDFRLHEMGPLCYLDLSLLSSDAFNVQLSWLNDVTNNAISLDRINRDTGEDSEVTGYGEAEGSATDTNANPNSHYTYVLRDFDTGDVLYTVDCNTGDDPNGQNTNPWISLSGYAVGNVVYVQWDSGNLADGDEFTLTSSFGGWWQTFANGITDDTSNLPYDQPVSYHIEDSLSGASADETIVTGPQGVQTLAASPHSSISIQVSWSGPDDGTTSLYRGTDPDFQLDASHLIAQGLASTGGSFTDTGLTAGTKYYYKAVNWNDAGSPSVTTVGTTTLSAAHDTEYPVAATAWDGVHAPDAD
jgi:hypothetical protein